LIITDLVKAGVLKPGSNIPKWLPHNVHYLTIMGSMAYGVSVDDSDRDIYGFAMPPIDSIFPHLAGHIPGFGPAPNRFEQWQEHHLLMGVVNYDFSVYSIVKFFHLCAENNPNMIDSLFTPRTCIIHATEIANQVRERRREFLHRGAVHKFRGYAYAQMHKIRTKTNPQSEKRKADVAAHGYDLKFAYHVVRLINECIQILKTGDLDLQKDNEILKSVRRGEWTLERLESWFEETEKTLEAIAAESKLPHKPNMGVLTELLMNCIESHYGTVSKLVTLTDTESTLLGELKAVIERYS
jgi:predicted nucleotidyltransferase